ncbi:hypothetical protein P389DRAFT_178441 [Cystobasidium minutum MCA 4210]|uniref:uncharacterized protein n=1 Tax=Cystobasidium minutum MCA 4210 TaxID=1397322 RepID=UPI0034CE7EAA|eukprot:jgi/Rhomi1/178441/fgenesh1_pg.2_\
MSQQHADEEEIPWPNIPRSAADWKLEDAMVFCKEYHEPCMKRLINKLNDGLKKELAKEKAKAQAGGWPIDLSRFPADYDVDKEENISGQCEYRQALLDAYIEARHTARAKQRAILRARAAAREAEEKRLKRESTLWGRAYNYLFARQIALATAGHALDAPEDS